MVKIVGFNKAEDTSSDAIIWDDKELVNSKFNAFDALNAKFARLEELNLENYIETVRRDVEKFLTDRFLFSPVNIHDAKKEMSNYLSSLIDGYYIESYEISSDQELNGFISIDLTPRTRLDEINGKMAYAVIVDDPHAVSSILKNVQEVTPSITKRTHVETLEQAEGYTITEDMDEELRYFRNALKGFSFESVKRDPVEVKIDPISFMPYVELPSNLERRVMPLAIADDIKGVSPMCAPKFRV